MLLTYGTVAKFSQKSGWSQTCRSRNPVHP